MLKIKTDNIFISKLFHKFINHLIYTSLKIKIEKLILFSFFY